MGPTRDELRELQESIDEAKQWAEASLLLVETLGRDGGPMVLLADHVHTKLVDLSKEMSVMRGKEKPCGG